MEYKRSESEFQKKIFSNKKLTKTRRPHELPSDIKDITMSPSPTPDVALVSKNASCDTMT